jgi:hypothetical protein
MLFICSLAMIFAASTAPPSPRVRRSATPRATHVPLSSEAPADEYFGPLHLSAIAIRMRIDVLGRRYSARTESDDNLVHDAGDVETALKLWNQRYPNDVWAAPTAYHLAQLYQEIQTATARARARAAFAYVASAYPTSKFGHVTRLRLAQGFPPLHAESPVVASPGPSVAASPTAPTPKSS